MNKLLSFLSRLLPRRRIFAVKKLVLDPMENKEYYAMRRPCVGHVSTRDAERIKMSALIYTGTGWPLPHGHKEPMLEVTEIDPSYTLLTSEEVDKLIASQCQ